MMIDAMQITATHEDRSASITVAAPPLWTLRGLAFRVVVIIWRQSCYWMAALGVPR